MKKMDPLNHDLLMRGIKVLDIGYITCIYVAFSMLTAKVIDNVMGKFDETVEEKKSVAQITLEMVLLLWAFGVMVYVVRNLAELIPFPLNGYKGFDHMKVKELKGASIFIITFLMFCTYIKDKVMYYYKRF
jgi:hypothetical protein